MARKAVISGQLNMVDESTGVSKLNFDLTEVFPVLTSIQEQSSTIRQVQASDGDVALDPNGVGTIRGFLIYVKSGSGDITVKHNGNAAGFVGKSFLLFGTLASILVSTTETQPLTIEYLFFQ